jgi:CheY-like chemotaxis protein
MSSSTILAVGHDPLLLKTRSQILREAGYTVVSVPSPSRAIACLLEGEFDLIMVCHSIPVQIRERLAELMREQAVRTPIVTIAPSPAQQDAFADATIEDDPQRLLADLNEILQERERTSEDGTGFP